MVKSTIVSLTPAQHAINHRYGGSDPLTGDVRIDPVTFNSLEDVHDSRSFNIAYHNDGTKPIFVTVGVYATTTPAEFDAYVSTSSDPTDNMVCMVSLAANGDESSLSFVVPAGYYYTVGMASGAGTRMQWEESS